MLTFTHLLLYLTCTIHSLLYSSIIIMRAFTYLLLLYYFVSLRCSRVIMQELLQTIAPIRSGTAARRAVLPVPVESEGITHTKGATKGVGDRSYRPTCSAGPFGRLAAMKGLRVGFVVALGI